MQTKTHSSQTTPVSILRSGVALAMYIILSGCYTKTHSMFLDFEVYNALTFPGFHVSEVLGFTKHFPFLLFLVQSFDNAVPVSALPGFEVLNAFPVPFSMVERFTLLTNDHEMPPSQTADNTWHREEEPLNHHETPGRQIKQSNQLSLPHQDDCNTRMDIK